MPRYEITAKWELGTDQNLDEVMKEFDSAIVSLKTESDEWLNEEVISLEVRELV
jgi:hypothetical protein